MGAVPGNRPLALLLALLFLGGCFGHGRGAPPTPTATFQGPPPEPRLPIADGHEPDDFAPPAFQLRLVATIMPAAFAAQPLDPSIASRSDGAFLLATPTCDRPEPLGPGLQSENLPKCQQRPVYLSSADGGTWTRLNKDPNGRIDRRQQRRNGHG